MGSLVFLIESDSQAGIVPARGGAVKNYNTGMCAPPSNLSAYDILFRIRERSGLIERALHLSKVEVSIVTELNAHLAALRMYEIESYSSLSHSCTVHVRSDGSFKVRSPTQ
jgi:hypothetical protein